MNLQNRVVVSPMAQYKAVDGTPTDWHLVHYGERAKGGAGLVYTEMTCVSPEGRITPGCPGLYAPEHEARGSASLTLYMPRQSENLLSDRSLRPKGIDADWLGRNGCAAERW
jgi:2,4-dienoyl-CoA reductase-like NADH-dependent reductase (Old Yellow Enzyme family)